MYILRKVRKDFVSAENKIMHNIYELFVQAFDR